MTVEQIQAHNYRINANIIACQIRCEGMKTENAARERDGYAQAWPESCFEDLATEVDRLAGSFVCD